MRRTGMVLAGWLWAMTVLAGEPTWRVGTGRADITPTLAPEQPVVWLAGYAQGRRATRVESRLSVRAMSLSDGRRRVVLATADLIGLFVDEVRTLRAEYAAAHPERPVDYLIVCATHTHAGPDTIGIWGPPPRTGVNPAYLAVVRKQALSAIAAATAAEQPATLKVARTELPDLISDSRLPIVIDQSVWVLVAETAHADTVGNMPRRTLATITNWGIHPEVLDASNTAVSADFPGVLREELEAKLGGTALHISGALGGLTAPAFPATDGDGQPWNPNRNQRVVAYGRTVARRVLSALAGAEPLPGPQQAPLEFRSTEVRVPLENPLYLAGFGLGVIRRKAVVLPTRPGVDGQRAEIVTEVGLLRVGPLVAAVIPGELYPELSVGGIPDPAEAGADFPDAPREPLLFGALPSDIKYRWVLGLANDEIGYLLPRRQWDTQPPYCYGRDRPQYGEENSVGPAAGPIVVEAFQRLSVQSR